MLGFLLFAASLASRVSATPTIALQPLGSVDSALVEALAEHVRSSLPATVTVLPPEPLPDSAFYSPRRRYRGDSLLDFLDRTTPTSYSRVIGITAKDVSVTKANVTDWGVFGVAHLSGRPGIVSTFRLARAAAAPLLQTRLANVTIHELGHTLGLPHCTTAGCVMRDAEGGIEPVDSSTGDFCDVCAVRVAETLQ